MSFLEALWTTFTCWMAYLANYLYYFMVEAAEFVLSAILLAVGVLLALLPSFVLDEPDIANGPVGWLNYFIPITSLMVGFGGIMFCWILYRVYVVVLRWGKVADDS